MGGLTQHTREVFARGGHWVVRAEPRGVPIRRDLWSRGYSIGSRVRRWLRRDRAWVVGVRQARDDPLGPTLTDVVVASKSEVGAEMDRMEQRLRDPLQFRVLAVFTITGRGLVAAGIAERGAVRTGDAVEVIHDGKRRVALCRGVEMIDGKDIDLRTIGLLLPGLTKDDVGEGDVIRDALV